MPGVRAALIAAALGLANAGFSAYWAIGGQGLLDTIGGDVERWARDGGAAVVITLSLIAALKTTIALAAPVLAGVGQGRLPAWTRGRAPSALGWIAAVVLTLYGAVWTVTGLLAQADLIEPATSNSKALAWHAYLWDPWFAAWGLAFVIALRRRSRRGHRDGDAGG